MAALSFFTPIKGSIVDAYFDFGGEQATIIPGTDHKKVILAKPETKPSCWTTALKVISYCTIVFPLIMLIAKALLRLTRTFTVIDLDLKKRQEGSSTHHD